MFKFENGDQVKDTVTGFKGEVVCQLAWNNGCIRYGVQAKMDKEGKIPDIQYIDEEQIELIKPKKVAKVEPSGGDLRQEPESF